MYESKFVFSDCLYVAQQCILFFGNQVYLCALGISEVNRDDFVLWRVVVGVEIQFRPVVCDAEEELRRS